MDSSSVNGSVYEPRIRLTASSCRRGRCFDREIMMLGITCNECCLLSLGANLGLVLLSLFNVGLLILPLSLVLGDLFVEEFALPLLLVCELARNQQASQEHNYEEESSNGVVSKNISVDDAE